MAAAPAPPGLEVDGPADRVRDLVDALPPRQRLIVLLRYYSDLSVAEVAEQAGCRVGTVKATLHHARRSLAKGLGHHIPTSTPDRNGAAMPLAHWRITGTHRHEYELDLTDDRVDAHRVAVLRCIVDEPGGFGAQVQAFRSDAYWGSRIRFAGRLRTEGASGWAGFWMRVDQPAQTEHLPELAFYNNQDRGLTGTTDWIDQDVVLDVPDGAGTMLIGAILSGPGSLYLADYRLEVVGPDVPVTRQPANPNKPLPGPTNLSFEED